MRTRRLLVLLVLTTLAAGCGNQRGPDSAKPSLPESSQQLRPNERDAVDALALGAAGDPSDFQWGDQIFHFLTEEGRVVDEQPWTACLGNGCWDGGPGLGGPIPSVGSPDALYFAFDYPGWKFHWVSFNPVDDECGGRSITVRATPVTRWPRSATMLSRSMAMIASSSMMSTRPDTASAISCRASDTRETCPEVPVLA